MVYTCLELQQAAKHDAAIDYVALRGQELSYRRYNKLRDDSESERMNEITDDSCTSHSHQEQQQC